MLPAELQTEQSTTPNEKTLADASAWYMRYATAIEYVPRTTYRKSTYETIQVLNEAGVSQFSTIDFEFDPVAEQIFVNRLEVFDPTGKFIASGDVADYFVADATGTEVSSNKKILHLPVPGVRPGCRIELCVTKQDITPPKTLPFTKHSFCSLIPSGRETLVLITDPAQVTWETTGNVQPRTGANYLSWQLDAPITVQSEPFQDSLDSFVPAVRFIDKQTNWRSELEEYEKQIQDLTTVSDRIRQLSAEVTKTATDPGAKIASLLHYVQDQLTYKAIEFGRRSRIMNSAEKTLRNKYGDCKDHSLLLCQLLQAAGIPAQLALVNTHGFVSDKTQSLDQFNHMVVFVPNATGGRFIDATAKNVDPTLPVPYGLAGKSALLLDSENPQLMVIPEYPPESNLVEVERQVQISNNGTLDVDDRLSYSGYFASSMRSLLKPLNTVQRKATVQEFFPNESNAQVQNVAIESLEEIERPLVVDIKYRCEHLLQQNEQQLVGRLPAPWELTLLSTPAAEQRTAPVWLQFPLHVRDTITVEFPRVFMPDDKLGAGTRFIAVF